jgi:class 3 adenylate cyclase/tetratricopeptide (TPR) repeat protein
MKCPKCQFENNEGLEFCSKCGQKLQDLVEVEKVVPEFKGERKHVTVLFSDLSGYTTISEKLDPEEVKEFTTRLFGKISGVITKYEGLVEKFIGDAVVALFGVPRSYEDGPVRAIRAAREIHELVDAESPELEKRLGHPLAMHTGINTGLVVTGEVDVERGIHGVTGDTINLASRLQDLANAGEILVGLDTYRQSEGYFNFEELEPTKVKGKEEPVRIYRVLSPKEEPIKIHRLRGVRAELIGRKGELAKLEEAVNNLRTGKGTIFSISGDAGTGKSRLVEEFKATLDLEEIQWCEGNAYAYSQNIPYFPLIDFLNTAFQIEEGDPPNRVKERVELGTQDLVGSKKDIIPFVGSLYSLSYPEVENVSPEFWKARLLEALQTIFAALAQRTPAVFCFEDLHWADPSFLELLRKALLEIRQPGIVLCVYRPEFNLFTTDQLERLGKFYQEIHLRDFSLSQAQDMLESLLETEAIPADLRRLVEDKAEGNPFYLEELVNSLIESETLVRHNGSWKIKRPINESDISSTIHGVISGRLDRLEMETKRILREASVIGRVFLYEILRRITQVKKDIKDRLRGLEQQDLIRLRSLQPELEYVFKHALTKEVVYNGLLKKERKEIHERIGLIMEQIFHDRLPELYETLGYHFKRGQSTHKAIHYLMKSGEKSLRRYAVEESHQYYDEAFKLLADKPERTKEEETLLMDLLIKWAYVFYYRGDFKGLVDLFSAHEGQAESIENKEKLGLFYAWLGFALGMRGRAKDSYAYLSSALELGEETGNQEVIAYACTWLTWTCADMGLLEKAVFFGGRAQEIYRVLKSDPYIYFKSLSGMGWVYWPMGERKKCFEAGKALLEYGRKHSNIRSLTVGHFCMGGSYWVDGNFALGIESFQRALEISADPFYSQCARWLLGMGYLFAGQLDEAEGLLQQVVTYSHNFGAELIGAMAYMFLGLVSIAKGRMSQGMRMLEEVRRASLKNKRRLLLVQSGFIMGKLYLGIVEGSGPKSLSIMVRNIGFLIKNVPFASKRAETHFKLTIEAAKEMGAIGILSQAYFDLGLLQRAKGRTGRARECISKAINLFEQSEAESYLKQAREALASLK